MKLTKMATDNNKTDLNLNTNNHVSVKKAKSCFNPNLLTKTGQRTYMGIILVMTTLPLIALLVTTGMEAYQNGSSMVLRQTLIGKILLSIEIGTIIHRIQIERGTTALFISSGGEQVVLDRLLYDMYPQTDSSINSLSQWPDSTSFSVGLPHFDTVGEFKSYIQKFREELNVSTITTEGAIEFYTDINTVLADFVVESVKLSRGGSTWKTLVAFHMLLLSKEQAGIERALGSTFYATGKFEQNRLLWYAEKRILGKGYLARSLQYSENIYTFMNSRYWGSPLETNIELMRDEIYKNNLTASSVMAGIIWFDNMTAYINILKKAHDVLGGEIVNLLEEESSDLRRTYIVSILMMSGSIGLFPCVLICVFKLTTNLQSFGNKLQDKTLQLEKERKRGLELLYRMLPATIAQKLMDNEVIPPRSYDSVTIFFSDIVGFTIICSQCTPLEVIDMLNLIYKTFDDRLEKYDVYKVETIGDAYMVVSGLPQTNGDRHANEIAFLALDLLRTIDNLNVPQIKGQKLRIRIGVNTGSIVAGVVGKKMPRYCLCGDAVNVASRMESSGEPNKIQISSSTNTLISRYSEFITVPRGQVNIKGKGYMTTYWLLEANLEKSSWS